MERDRQRERKREGQKQIERKREQENLRIHQESSARQHKMEQEGIYEQMVVLGDNSVALFVSIPEYLKAAEKHLNQGELDFSEGAFAPFWDSIENAAKALGRFDEGVQNIQKNSSQYRQLIQRYEDVPPKFPLASATAKKLSVGTTTAARMKAIARTAQCNFQFATIYEQRKTNQILIAGFTNLAQALDRMTWQITDSIDNLASSVGVMESMLQESMNAIHSGLGDMAKSNAQHQGKIIERISDQAEMEKKALEMLDNIQHHRKPA